MTFPYQSRNASGTVCCAGNTPDFPRCDRCKVTRAAPRALASRSLADLQPPDPYAHELDALRTKVKPPTLPRAWTPADTPDYERGAPPNGYQIALDKRKEHR